MLKFLTNLLIVILLGSCIKKTGEPAGPSPSLTPLPLEVIRNYEAFLCTDTLFTTGINGSILGFAYRDYRGQFNRYWEIPDWILTSTLLKIARDAYKKVFSDSLKIDYPVITQYEILLEIQSDNGSWYFDRQWPLLKIARH